MIQNCTWYFKVSFICLFSFTVLGSCEGWQATVYLVWLWRFQNKQVTCLQGWPSCLHSAFWGNSCHSKHSRRRVSLINVATSFFCEHVSQSLVDTYAWCSSYYKAVKMDLCLCQHCSFMVCWWNLWSCKWYTWTDKLEGCLSVGYKSVISFWILK